MKQFHPLSFAVGLLSGFLLVFVVTSGMRMMGWTHGAPRGGQYAQQGQSRTARMAKRLGITEQELQKELDAGKTMQQIAQEHGVTLPAGGFGRGPRNGSGARTGSGAPTPPQP